MKMKGTHTAPSSRPRRRGEAVRVSDVLPRRLRASVGPGRIRWRTVVGPDLGAVSVPVDVDPAGVLRVMAINEAACHEVQARAPHVLATWNAAAAKLGAAQALDLVCWVNAALVIEERATPTRARRPAPQPVEERDVARARDELGDAVTDAGVREALARIRARQRRRDRR